MISDPKQFIFNMRPGSVFCAHLYHPEESVCFLVREKSDTILHNLREPVVTVVSGLFVQNGIGLLTIMFMIGPDINHFFETWIDYHMAENEGERIFNLISTQENIVFHFYGDSLRVEKLVQINNSLGDFFLRAAEQIKKLQPWGSRDFAFEREAICRKYPTCGDRWNALFMHGEGN
ncbi:MAG: hypothetical protein HQL08_06810 [Nitrospirae bacterium]|nr:hypothetical protein [Nitrospirota bacterium]